MVLLVKHYEVTPFPPVKCLNKNNAKTSQTFPKWEKENTLKTVLQPELSFHQHQVKIL